MAKKKGKGPLCCNCVAGSGTSGVESVWCKITGELKAGLEPCPLYERHPIWDLVEPFNPYKTYYPPTPEEFEERMEVMRAVDEYCARKREEYRREKEKR